MGFYAGKKVLVTGGSGFLGSNLVEALLREGAGVKVATRRPKDLAFHEVEAVSCDIADLEQCRVATRGAEHVFHLAAFGWGLGANVKAQPQLLTQNLIINTNMLEAARLEEVGKYLIVSSSAVYGSDQSTLDDEVPWVGDPHPSEHCFGWAKRMAEIQAQAYQQHYGMQIAIVRPSNPYGPMDNFDPEQSHVIPALIRRALSKEDPFIVWGTGKVIRNFVYSGDVARGMLLALERYAVADPVNLASLERLSITDLAKLVLEICGFPDATLEFDLSKPEGHPGKFPKVRKAEEKLGFRAQTPIREGLEKTVQWYVQHQALRRSMTQSG